MKRITLFFLLTSFFLISLQTVQAQIINSEVIRFHVIANSDSKEDQILKLQVRDRLLTELAKLDQFANIDDAGKYIKDNLDKLKKIAKQEIINKGYNYQVQVSLTKSNFPTRKYGQKVLPAGEYVALKVIIGQGKGANWWCVLYPPLCHGDWVKKDKGYTRVEGNASIPVVANNHPPTKNTKEDNSLKQITNLWRKILLEVFTVSKSP